MWNFINDKKGFLIGVAVGIIIYFLVSYLKDFFLL